MDFCHIETSQSAYWYGFWTNPFEGTIIRFNEGEVTIEEYGSNSEFIRGLQQLADWNRAFGYWEGIDRRSTSHEVQLRLIQLGLAGLLYDTISGSKPTGPGGVGCQGPQGAHSMAPNPFYQICKRVLEEEGVTPLPYDHPVYSEPSEPPSIVFLSRKPGQKDQKAIVSLPEDSPLDSDRPRKKKQKK